MEVPKVFDLPDATFTLMPVGIKFPPSIPAKGWQLPENGHTYQEALEHDGNVGFRAGNGYIGFDLDDPSAFEGLSIPPTTTWETRPGRFGKLFTGTVPPEVMEHYGKPANHSQFFLFKGGKQVGEVKLERSYQCIPKSWKKLDDGQVVTYRMVDSRPPAAIELGKLMSDILSLPGVSLSQNSKPNTSTSQVTAMTVDGTQRPVETSEVRDRAYANAALLRELAATENAPESTRYNQVYKSGCALGELCAAGLLPFDATLKALIEAGEVSGLPRYKAEESAKNGMNRTKNKPRQIPAPTCSSPPPGYSGHDLDGMLWVEGSKEVKPDIEPRGISQEEFEKYKMPEGAVSIKLK